MSAALGAYVSPELERVFRAARGTAELQAYADALEACSDQRQQAIFRALQYVGVSEDAGPNEDSSGHIRRWLAEAGAPPGSAWCAAFVSEFLPATEPPCAGALNLARRYPKIPPTALQLFDLFAYPTDDKGHGHVGYVIGFRAAEAHAGGALIMTLEGNAQNACRVQLRRAEALGMRFARAPFASLPGVRCPPVVRAGVRLVETASATR